jgi:hypothetical protein
LIMGAAYVAHPNWFCGLHTDSWQHILIAAIIALAAGNIWFAINRYGFHQVIDYLMYLLGIKGPFPSGSRWNYHDDLGRYVKDSVCMSAIPQRARQHIAFRASSILLLYTIAEIGIIFSFWNEPDTLFAQHRCWTISGSLAIFVAGVWQLAINRHIDYWVVEFGRTPPRKSD